MNIIQIWLKDFETINMESRYYYIIKLNPFNIMRAKLIQEFQLLQNSRANKFADELTDRFKSSMDLVTEKVNSSISQRGNMLMQLDRKLTFSLLKRFKNKFFKF